MSGAEVEYATDIGGVEVVVGLRSVEDLVSELEATGRCGVRLAGAACVGVIGPESEEAVRALLGDGAGDVDVARAVFGEDTEPEETPLAHTYLLACSPLDAPESAVEEMFAR